MNKHQQIDNDLYTVGSSGLYGDFWGGGYVSIVKCTNKSISIQNVRHINNFQRREIYSRKTNENALNTYFNGGKPIRYLNWRVRTKIRRYDLISRFLKISYIYTIIISNV